jgi:membrane protease YdiL (CAAX protease family)
VIINDPSPPSGQLVIEPELRSGPSAEHSPVINPRPDHWWQLGKAFLAWIGSIVLLIITQLIFVVPYLVHLMVSTKTPIGEGLIQDKTFLLLSIIAIIPAHILTALLAWILVTNWRRKPFSQTLGLSWPPEFGPWKGFGLCLLLALVLLGVGVLITALFGGGKTDLDRLIESSYQARVATAFIAIFTAPFVEEVIYRGMLYPALNKIVGTGWAIAIVSIMFAGVHVPQYKNNISVILAITILSIALTTLRAVSGKLLPSIVVHLIFNGVQSAYLILEPFFNKPDKIEPTPALIQFFRVIRHSLF